MARAIVSLPVRAICSDILSAIFNSFPPHFPFPIVDYWLPIANYHPFFHRYHSAEYHLDPFLRYHSHPRLSSPVPLPDTDGHRSRSPCNDHNPHRLLFLPVDLWIDQGNKSSIRDTEYTFPCSRGVFWFSSSRFDNSRHFPVQVSLHPGKYPSIPLWQYYFSYHSSACYPHSYPLHLLIGPFNCLKITVNNLLIVTKLLFQFPGSQFLESIVIKPVYNPIYCSQHRCIGKYPANAFLGNIISINGIYACSFRQTQLFIKIFWSLFRIKQQSPVFIQTGTYINRTNQGRIKDYYQPGVLNLAVQMNGIATDSGVSKHWCPHSFRAILWKGLNIISCCCRYLCQENGSSF